MPPCAQRVEPASSSALVTRSTRPAARACSAAVSPAMPLPTTTTSAVANQPGAAARRRPAITGTASRIARSRIDAVPAQQTGVRQRFGGVIAGADDAVVGVDDNALRAQLSCFGIAHGAVADDDDQVALVDKPCSRSVDAD